MKNFVFCIYIYHCQIALHYHLSMVCTYLSKEAAIFVATGKMLKIHILICLSKSNFCHFLTLNSTSNVGYSFLWKSFPLLVSHRPNFFFKSLSPFWNLQNLDSIDLLIPQNLLGYDLVFATIQRLVLFQLNELFDTV